MEAPETLARKIDLFRRCGRVIRHEDELFAEDNWIAILLGQNLWPQRYDPLVDTLPQERIVETLRAMAALVRQTAEALPPHREFILRSGGAAARTGEWA